jgi:hypothetical protein
MVPGRNWGQYPAGHRNPIVGYSRGQLTAPLSTERVDGGYSAYGRFKMRLIKGIKSARPLKYGREVK